MVRRMAIMIRSLVVWETFSWSTGRTSANSTLVLPGPSVRKHMMIRFTNGAPKSSERMPPQFSKVYGARMERGGSHLDPFGVSPGLNGPQLKFHLAHHWLAGFCGGRTAPGTPAAAR